ncbi:MAG TPA: carboxypeptidase-like regulatory domain-containing protein [Candidatus Thermoplasmatota archaeon]
MRSLAVLIVVTFLVAGCADKPDATENDGTEPTDSALPPGITNVLEGTVQASDVGPLEGVFIRLDGSNQTRNTTAAGYFRFENLEPRDYIVIASFDGYRPKTLRAVIEESKVFQLDFVLEAIPVAKPYHETTILRGLIECQVHYQTNEDSPNRPSCGTGVDPNARPTLLFNIGPAAAQVMIEMTWVPRTQLANHLTLTAHETKGQTELASVHSANVLRVAVSENVIRKFYQGGGELVTRVEPGPSVTGDEAAADVGLTFQQDYEIHLTVFYHEIGPPTFTAIPE